MKRALLAAATAALAATFALPALAAAAPTARFTYTPADPYTGESVRFDASSSTCDDSPCQYRFRDVTSSGTSAGYVLRAYASDPIATFTFHGVGTKYVQLTVRNANGAASRTTWPTGTAPTQTKAIRVEQGPRPTPTPAECADGEDNDADGLVDLADPGCSRASDNDETESAPPPTDADRDGVPDSSDQCPTQAGPAPTGCPGSPPPPSGSWPTPSTTGVPENWTPAQTRSTDLTVTTNGAVVEDILFTGSANLNVRAQNVTIRRVKFSGSGQINGDIGSTCANGATIEDSTFEYPGTYDPRGIPVIQWIGFTGRRLKVMPGRSEGVFVGGKSQGCGPAMLEDSFIKITDNRDCVLHADGLQGYDGNAVTIRNVVSDSRLANCGTAPFFYPANQGNIRADIDRLFVIGGTYSFRLGMPATVKNLLIGDDPASRPYGYSQHSWAYGPMNVKCSVVSTWDAKIVRFTGFDFDGATTVATQPCDTQDGT